MHFGRGFEVLFRVGLEQEACFIERDAVANAGEHIVQWLAIGRVVVHIVGRKQAEAARSGEIVEPLDPGNIAAAIKIGGGDVAEGR